MAALNRTGVNSRGLNNFEFNSFESGYSQSNSEHFAVKHANKVMGLVYIGAAILIIIVGLRGMGTAVGNLSMIPDFLIDQATNKIDSAWVMFALFLEFFMLMLLSVITFFTPNDEKENTKTNPGDLVSLSEIKKGLTDLKDFTETEISIIKTYLNEVESITGKINKIQSNNAKALRSITETLSESSSL